MAAVQTANQRVVALGVSLIQQITGHQGEGRDVTNPRELYAIIALADAKREQTSLAAPLNLDTTFEPSQEDKNNMYTKAAEFSSRRQRQHTRPNFHRSMDVLETCRENMPDICLLKQSSSLNDLSKTKQSSEHEHEKQQFISTQEKNLFLPEIEKKNTVTFKDSISKKSNKNFQVSKAVSVNRSQQSIPSSEKIKTELFTEKYQGINGINLQKSILARLRLRNINNELSRDVFPKTEPNRVDLRVYDKYPNQYWELRSETVHQPQDLEADMIDRERYRLQQKSALKLKVMDQDRRDRRPRDLSVLNHHDDITKRSRQKARPHSDTQSLSEPNESYIFNELIIGPVSENNAPLPLTSNHHLAEANTKKSKPSCPYFLTDDDVKINRPTPSRTENSVSKVEIGTSVVNISIEHDVPKKRNPKHIEQRLVKQQESQMCGLVKEPEMSSEYSDSSNNNMQRPRTDQADRAGHTPSQLCKIKRQNEHRQKALLQGFKKIEVFGEHKQKSQSSGTQVVLKITDEPKKYIPRCHPPVYKLDMRNYPPQGNAVTNDNNINDNNNCSEFNRCQSRSVKIVDGTIILKHTATDPDNWENAVKTADNNSRNLPEGPVGSNHINDESKFMIR